MNNLSSNWFKSNTYLKLQSYCSDDVEAGKDNLEKFFEEIENVKDDMSSVEKLYKKLQEANEESKIVHNAKTMKELRSRIDSDAKRVLKRVKIIKGKLEALERSNAANRSLPGSGPGSSVDRTRTLVVSGLGKKLKSLMDDFQGLRATMQSEYKETVKRRYFTVTGERASEETLESLISSGESESFLRNAIQEQKRGPKMDADYYSEINQERSHDDAVLKETEKSLLELHEIFLDMAALVGSQGHQMSDIESHVACASSFVRRGTEGLEEAKEYRPKSQASAKWRHLAMALAAVVIFVMLLPFLATMLPHFLGK